MVLIRSYVTTKPNEITFTIGVNVIPSAARNLYGSFKKLRDYSAYPPAGYDGEHLLV